MSAPSPEGSDTSGNPASSSSTATIGSNMPQQQHIQPQPPPQPQPQQSLHQQLHDGSSNSPSSTTVPNSTSTPHQPLFLKPHPTLLSSTSSASTNPNPETPAIGTTATTSSTAGTLPPTSPLATTPQSSVASTTAAAAAAAAAATTTVATTPATATANDSDIANIIANNPHYADGKGVKEPLPTDVICGRGKMTASHPANRRFRELVDFHKAAYQNSKRRDEKTRITCELVDQLRGEGRFVLYDPNTKMWHEVSEEYAREKVSHSLRSRSSTEQRIANAASNSIKMLNSAVPQETNDVVVSVVPPGAHGANRLASQAAPKASKVSPTGGASPPYSNAKAATKSKQQQQHISGSSNNSRNSNNSSSKKSATPPHKKKAKLTTAHKGSSSARSSKHSSLKPGLDEIVKRLIQDQQKLLRMMIQKETDRFTSAAASGSLAPRPPMPLSYKAEASAVSKLTASLPKLEESIEGGIVVSNAAAGTSSTAPKDETPPSPKSTIAA